MHVVYKSTLRSLDDRRSLRVEMSPGIRAKVTIGKIDYDGNIMQSIYIVNKLPEVTAMTNRITRMMCYNLARFP